MAVRRLHATDLEKAARFSVIGMYLADSGTSFVQHVAILRDDAELRYAMQGVRVCHMGPPLVAGAQSAGVAQPEECTCAAHLIGDVELDAEEIEGVKTWLVEVDKEIRPTNKLRQYIVDPPMKWVEAENKTRLYRRFSCAGFVLECYRSVDIDLIRVADAERLPEVDLETVARAYGDSVRRETLRSRLGIPGDGPWRIVLAGYIMHALNRTDHLIRQIPHVPSSIGERDFYAPIRSAAAARTASPVPHNP